MKAVTSDYRKTDEAIAGLPSANVLYISGHLSHDEDGNIIALAAVDEPGRIIGLLEHRGPDARPYVSAAKILAGSGLRSTMSSRGPPSR
jgi:hypothetical protein